jgi:hypothetical protein
LNICSDDIVLIKNNKVMEKLMTKNEKLKLVFEKLLIYLNPEEIENAKNDPRYYWKLRYNKDKYQFCKCNFDNIKNIKIPLDDFLIEVTEDNIYILSDDLEYNIAPDQLLTIYNRIKKTLKR